MPLQRTTSTSTPSPAASGEIEAEPGFAVWLTGLPASGKSTIAGALVRRLDELGVDVVVLESDALRRLYTPAPRYTEAERDRFYAKVVHLAAWLTRRGVPVVIDATANRRRWRDAARRVLERFAEVWIDTPVEVCKQRDPKGLYASAAQGRATRLPGVGAPYEPPRAPELRVSGGDATPERAAEQIVGVLAARGWLPVEGGPPR